MQTRDGEEKVRRTRGSAPVKRCRLTIRVNGKRVCSYSFEKLANELDFCHEPEAASDDAGGATVVKAATSPAAGKVRPACAEVAQEEDGKGAKPRVPSEGDFLPAGTGELPGDGAEFVRLVDARVSLAAGYERLVRSSDLKISQRALEKLSELSYKAAPGGAVREPQFELEATPTYGFIGEVQA
jgi:hypothetical protein